MTEKTRSRKKQPEVRTRKKKKTAGGVPAPAVSALRELDFDTEIVSVDSLRPHPENYKDHPADQLAHIAASLKEHGFYKNVVVARDGTILAGHGVWEATKSIGGKEIPVRRLPIASSSAAALKIVAADNEIPLLADRDEKKLAAILRKIQESDGAAGLLGTGFDDKSMEALLLRAKDPEVPNPLQPRSESGALLAKFGVPPFSVLDARQGYWQERKRAWIDLGIRSEEGRGDDASEEKGGAKKTSDGVLYKSIAVSDPAFYSKKRAKEAELGRELSLDDFVRDHYVPVDAGANSGTSVFDPVLCELGYRWFSPKGGTVLDPFAGGSVRGVVAACLGRSYVGVDLSKKQIEANRKQWEEIAKRRPEAVAPKWIVGDSREIPKLARGVEADLIFSCPPYADLERYSDDPKDLSTLEYPDFRAAYFEIIEKACAQLRNDRFAIFVVGEVRSKSGAYLNFVPDTIEAFRKAGLAFYNEAILLTAIASLPMRVSKGFETARKLGKTHQNVLVFVKGSAKKAVAALGDVEFGDLSAESSAPKASGVEEITLGGEV